MVFVLDIFVLAAFVVVLFFVGAVVLSKRRDDRDAAKKAEIDRSKQLREQLNALRYKAGEPLVCLGCEHFFDGPLPETGCPQCCSRDLVITKEELRMRANEN